MSAALATNLQPVKASLVSDLVDLVNLDLSRVVKVSTACCTWCDGHGEIGDDAADKVTCASCGGVGAVEAFVIDMQAVKSPQIGRHVEQWELKQGQLVPKFRGKTQAFALLVKILGFDKAVLEVTGAVSYADSLTPEQRAQFVDQVRELALAGRL